MRTYNGLAAMVVLTLVLAAPAAADVLLFSTGDPDGLMAMASRLSGAGKTEIEAADDFIAPSTTQISSATFTGLLSGSATTANIVDVSIEIYRVFPLDSTVPPSTNVPTRANSPSDVAFDSRDAASSGLTFTTTLLSSSFTAANSVLNGINKSPGQTTGGEGAVTGQEVQFNVTFTTPLLLPADHYFFVPQVLLSGSDNFYWLSAPRPVTGQFAFSPDLQAWIRNEDLDPDWLRVGTDIVGSTSGQTFNGVFSLSGPTTPEPSSLILIASCALLLAASRASLRGRKVAPNCLVYGHDRERLLE